MLWRRRGQWPGERSPGRSASGHSLGAVFAWRRTALRRRVIVNLKVGPAVEGVLVAKRGPLLVLADSTLLEAGRATPIDGEAVIERSNVAFVQVRPAVVIAPSSGA